MLFPELRHASWGYLNLSLVAQDRLSSVRIGDPNPMLDPAQCSEMIAAAHTERSLDCSYGGWLENRRELWHGSYLDECGHHIHLGVDFNVPAGTQVAAEHDGDIVTVDNDTPEVSGWGTRVILRPHDPTIPVLIYGHLGPQPALRAGDRVRLGDTIGRVGEPHDNGGWFPHLHVQCVARGVDPLTLDGYGNERHLAVLSRTCPDPLRFVSPTR